MSHSEEMLFFAEQIKKMRTYEQLKKCHDRVIGFVHRHRQGSSHYLYVSGFYHNLNTLHDHMIYRVLQLVDDEMKLKGWSHPPVSYSWMLLGSGGRGEQTLGNDQDHAIVYQAEKGDETEVCSYLQQLAETIAFRLNQVGYPYCRGNVMAANPVWCLSVEEWKDRWQHWVTDPSIDHLRYFLISTDFRGMYGNLDLSRQLRNWFTRFIQGQDPFLHRLARHTSAQQIPVSWWGKVYPDLKGPHAGRLHLKDSVMVQLINSVRLWSFKYGIDDVSTEKRLMQLYYRGIWSKEDMTRMLDAFYFLLHLRLKNTDARGNFDHYILIKGLSRKERQQLGSVMVYVKKWQKKSVQMLDGK
ncbi:MAG: hypothetical protein H0Z33_11005 [Bacillaceae bacterium]|nr:hypothetical protein [Bacillaceae bacterium]